MLPEITRAQILQDLYANLELHQGQRELLNWVFVKKIPRILAVNGRNWGKTQSGMHILARSGLTRDGLHPEIEPEELIDSYYVAPSIVHARRIIWDNKRLHQIIPQKYILDVNKNDRMIFMTLNGKDPCAWMKVEGAENIWSLVGVKHRGILIIDETYMIDPAFLEAHEEDLAAWNPPLLLFSTWPKEYPHWIDKLAKEYQLSKEWKFMNRPGTENIFIERRNKNYFIKQKERYELRGDSIGYQREILSLRVFGGGSHIFPNFQCRAYITACNRGTQNEDTLTIQNPEEYQLGWEEKSYDDDHVFQHAALLKKIEKDKHHMTACVAVDPGHASRFACLFFLLNPYTKDLFYLDEIYEGNRYLVNTPDMLKKIYEKCKINFPWIEELVEIRKVCDEAALWFRMESASISQNEKGPTKGEIFAWVPTEKASYKAEYGFSMMKASMNCKKFHISDQCKWFIWEILNFHVDEKGKIPIKNDHLIDCCRYGLGLIQYLITEEDKPQKKSTDEFDAMSLAMGIEERHQDNSWGSEKDESWS